MDTNDEDTLAPHLCKCVLHRTCAVKFLQDLKTRSCRLCGIEYPLKLMDFMFVPPPVRIRSILIPEKDVQFLGWILFLAIVSGMFLFGFHQGTQSCKSY